MAREGRRGRRILWRFGVALAVACVVAGGAIAYTGYERTTGPDGAVRGYFAAVAAGDAPRALAWGDVPAGPHSLLTSDVLRLQQHIAPLRRLHIGAIDRTGSTAVVHVTYVLAFASQDVPVTAAVPVVQRDGDWQLRASAIVTQLSLDRAANRARVLHSAVPTGSTPMFPGAAPITLDTSYLELDPMQDAVGFGAGPLTDVTVQVSKTGRTAVTNAVGARLKACLTGSKVDTSCPLPSERYVAGSLRGSVPAQDLGRLTISLGPGPDGAVAVAGYVPMTGTYRVLQFDNRSRAGRGKVELKVRGYVYPVAPLTVVWTSS